MMPRLSYLRVRSIALSSAGLTAETGPYVGVLFLGDNASTDVDLYVDEDFYGTAMTRNASASLGDGSCDASFNSDTIFYDTGQKLNTGQHNLTISIGNHTDRRVYVKRIM